MKKFLETIHKLNSEYRKIYFLNMEHMVENGSKERYIKEKKEIIDNLKPIAEILVNEYELDEFDFSDDEKFFASVKKFLSRVD